MKRVVDGVMFLLYDEKEQERTCTPSLTFASRSSSRLALSVMAIPILLVSRLTITSSVMRAADVSLRVGAATCFMVLRRFGAGISRS